MQTILSKYADLLVNYCLDLKTKDKLFINSTTLAEPLVREVYRAALRAGAIVETELDFQGKSNIYYEEAIADHQLAHVSTLYRTAMQDFDAYLYIRAPFSLKEVSSATTEQLSKVKEANAPFHKLYFERTATRDLKRNLCQFPTLAAAEEAAMTLEEYENFVFGACKLFHENPKQAWLDVRQAQQKTVDLLNGREQIRYVGNDIDLTFNTKGRKWINSDGQTNMPSGEVYTSPVENSVNGIIRFSYPGLYQGHEVEDVLLHVKDGYIQHWEARKGKDFLDYIFSLEGTRRFGEAAIGTNYDINRMTKNILFDEKIGGTVHLAIGQSYLQCGGKNESSVHWDMITDMTQQGEIYADGEKIYEKGRFL
jgi:aminopeptidase